MQALFYFSPEIIKTIYDLKLCMIHPLFICFKIFVKIEDYLFDTL